MLQSSNVLSKNDATKVTINHSRKYRIPVAWNQAQNMEKVAWIQAKNM